MTKELWSDSQYGQENCLCSRISRLTVRPFQACIQWVLGLFLQMKWQRFWSWWLMYPWYWGYWVGETTSTPPYLSWHAPTPLHLYFYLNNEIYCVLHSLCRFLFRISESQAISVWGYAFRVNSNWHVQNTQCWDWRQIVPHQPDSCNWCARCDYSYEKCWSRWGCVLETHYFSICSGSCIIVNDWYVRTISYADIAQNHEVDGSKTGEVSEYSVRTDFPINILFKWGEWFQTIYFDQIKGYSHTYEKCTRNTNWPKKWHFKGVGISSSTVGRSFGSIYLISKNMGGDAEVPGDDLKKSRAEHLHNSKSSCCYCCCCRLWTPL